MGPALAGTPPALGAQIPPDSVKADSLRAGPPAPDTVPAPSDTVPGPPGEGASLPDSLAAADSLAADSVIHNLPASDPGIPPGWIRGVWEWDAGAIMASGANTLVELLQDVPGMVPIRGGDYGTPLALTAFGAAGGGLRVIRDGFELLPLAGSVPDLSRIGLGGIARVRLERRAGGLVVRLTSHRYTAAAPLSRVEVGTGDLDTNVFRGTFADPRALGGSVALALERADTRGPGGKEVGNRNGSWLRYQLHRGDDGGVAVDFRRMGTETEVDDYAATVTRTDWAVRGRPSRCG